jgi:hypothetical protein
MHGRKYFRKFIISYFKRSHEKNLDAGINLFLLVVFQAKRAL